MDGNAAKFAHDLKMPIQLIYSCIQLLEMEISPNARAEGYLKMLLHSANQLQNMVSGALEGEAPTGGAAMKVRDVVSEARQISRQCALRAREKGVRLHFETNAASFLMPTDPVRLQRMMNNLLFNALRFTPPGGHIAVSMGVRGDSVEISVRDTGCGIEEELQKSIFEEGVSAGSTGLGLANVRRFARELGGDVHLESAPGRGSCFTLRLPVPSLDF